MTRGTTLALLLAVSSVGGGALRAETLPELYKRVDGSVVVIKTHEKGLAPSREGGQPVSIAGLGSGVLISADGKILTAAHVVQAADSVVVEFVGGERIDADVISSQPVADVALLQLKKPPPRNGTTVAVLGDSEAAQVGDEVFIVGAPRGIAHTLTVGHISARRKPTASFSGMSMAEFFQTDAAINQGNSGGPMFSMKGEVVGIVSYIVSETGGSEGLGFVVTSKTARELMLERQSFWSGVDAYLVSGDMARVFNIPAPGSGLLVQRVAENSPAAAIGIQPGLFRATIGDEELIVGGDIILAVGGVSLSGPGAYERIRKVMDETAPGDKVKVTILRKGEVIELTGIRPR